MKLLVLAPQPFFQHRGTPIATLKMLHVLAADGHQIDLLTYHEGEPFSVPNCRHVRTPWLPFTSNIPPGFSIGKLISDVVMTFCVLRMCLRREYDLIHAVEESVFMAMVIRILFGIPYIYDMDSSLPAQIQDKFPVLKVISPLLKGCEQLAVRGSQGVVAVCQSLEDVAASHSDEVPIVRIEDASLLTEGRDNKPPEHGTPADLLALDGPILMYVGNLQNYQGIDLLLDSFVHVYHRYKNVHLVIVGGADEEILKYRTRASKIDILDRTHFLGPRPIEQLGEYLDHADVLVSPRTQGSNTPMKIFSYLESGTPVLATRLSTHTQVLDDEISVLAAPNPLAMAQGMCVLLEDEEMRARIAVAARERIRSRFNSELLDSKLTEFYQELAETLGCQ